jgi:hypothetical protein
MRKPVVQAATSRSLALFVGGTHGGVENRRLISIASGSRRNVRGQECLMWRRSHVL